MVRYRSRRLVKRKRRVRFARTSYVRRTFKRRHRYGLGRPAIGRQLLGYAKKLKFRYCDTITINADGTGLPSTYGFRANSLYDPDYTGAGHQPMGFDQIMPFFNHFTVIGSMITVKYVYISTSTNTPGEFGIMLCDTNALPSSINGITAFLESPRTTRTKSYGLVEGAGSAVQNPQLRMKYSAKKFFKQKQIVGDANHQGSAQQNPNEDVAFVIACFTSYNGDPPNAVFQVIIDYIAVLTEPNDLPQS